MVGVGNGDSRILYTVRHYEYEYDYEISKAITKVIKINKIQFYEQ